MSKLDDQFPWMHLVCILASAFIVHLGWRSFSRSSPKNAFPHMSILTDLLTPGISQYPSFADRIFNLWVFFAHPERNLTPEVAYVAAVVSYFFLHAMFLTFVISLDRDYRLSPWEGVSSSWLLNDGQRVARRWGLSTD